MLSKESAMSSSSLQKAANAGRPTKGQFEACFAGALDLSEFGSATSSGSTSSHASHAAALLRVKQAESAQKLQNEREEARLQEAAQRRKDKLKAESGQPKQQNLVLTAPSPSTHASSLAWKESQSKRNGGAASISALVVGMHSAEQKDEPKQKLLRRRAATRKQQRPSTKAMKTNNTRFKAKANQVKKIARRAERTKY